MQMLRLQMKLSHLGTEGWAAFWRCAQFNRAPPLWVNLLSFLMTPQLFNCCCHFSLLPVSVTHQKQNGEYLSQRIMLGFFFLLELPLLCDLCALLNNAALEVMTALSLLLKPNLEGKRRKKVKTVWNWLSVEQRCKAYMWLLWSGRK